tara:strand:+ start:39272 stop:41218 length:1947 start_codon:yes stop_codon:yes gene_type:complete
MSDKTIPTPASFTNQANLTPEKYQEIYQKSVKNPDSFWAEEAEKHLTWYKKWDSVSTSDLSQPKIEWFKGAQLNVAFNCIDRHLAEKGNQTAIIWEPNDPNDAAKEITFNQLAEEVGRFANTLKALGVERGDRVCLYMPMIPEATYAMLACARIGAIHSVVFAGFSAESLASRIDDAECDVVITADEGKRGTKRIPLKTTVDEALTLTEHKVRHVLTVQYTKADVPFDAPRDAWYHEASAQHGAACPPEKMEATDPLFILYTSGSTGTPKGVVHGTGGYLTYATSTFKTAFDYKEGDVFWCTADIGWITGHSYLIYGPLAAGCTTIVFEGIPTWPDANRMWQVVDRHKVNSFYTAPTAIRALHALGDEFVTPHDLSSLRVLGTVGEPINPEPWLWYFEQIGHSNCPIVDTWWQTETGGHLLAPFPGCVDDLKPGAAMTPYFGIEPELYTPEGKLIEGEGEGLLCFSRSWPGQMQTVWGDHERFEATYFSMFKGKYFTGDGAKRDADGHIWITGRVDDVLNVSGHRIGTAEVESAIVEHPHVTEAAVVGYPHDVKGQGIYAFITLEHGVEASDDLNKEIVSTVRKIIGPIASPDVLLFTDNLPKTRSGKIMRRILRKIAADETDSLGDISTLADPEVVERIIEKHNNAK